MEAPPLNAAVRRDHAQRSKTENPRRPPHPPHHLPRRHDPPGPHEAEPTRSELKRKLLSAIREAGLPRPLVNHRLGPYKPDFLWPEHRLVVETDGWAGHGHRIAFEDDRKRDAWFQAAGYKVLRFTWRQVMEETILVTVRIAQCTPHHASDTPPAGG